MMSQDIGIHLLSIRDWSVMMKSDAAPGPPEELSGTRTIADIALSKELFHMYTLFNTCIRSCRIFVLLTY